MIGISLSTVQMDYLMQRLSCLLAILPKPPLFLICSSKAIYSISSFGCIHPFLFDWHCFFLYSWRWLHWSQWAARNLPLRPSRATAGVFDGTWGGLHSKEQASEPVLQGHTCYTDLLQVQQRVGPPKRAHCGGEGWWKLRSVKQNKERKSTVYLFSLQFLKKSWSEHTKSNDKMKTVFWLLWISLLSYLLLITKTCINSSSLYVFMFHPVSGVLRVGVPLLD